MCNKETYRVLRKVALRAVLTSYVIKQREERRQKLSEHLFQRTFPVQRVPYELLAAAFGPLYFLFMQNANHKGIMFTKNLTTLPPVLRAAPLQILPWHFLVTISAKQANLTRGPIARIATPDNFLAKRQPTLNKN